MSQEELERYFSKTENLTGMIEYLKEKVTEDNTMNEVHRALGHEEEYWKRKYTLMSIKGLISTLRTMEQKLNDK